MCDFAVASGIPVYAPPTTNSDAARELLRSLAAELFAVCDFGEILSPETLSCARLGGINLHASLLPKYRGAAPINWAILKGERETGISVIHMTPRLDGGPILAVARTPIGTHETSADLEPRLAQLGIEPVLDSISLLSTWDGTSLLGQLQDQTLATHARRLQKSDGQVVWTRSAVRIRNQVRGLQPWPGVFTHYHKSGGPPLRLILDQVSLDCAAGAPSTIEPGHVAVVETAKLLIQTGKGLLSLDRVQPAGKKAMGIDEFLRGHKLQIGDHFGPE